jgi:ketosteroid isomerase-like protein
VAGAPQGRNLILAMFEWWNNAYCTGGFTADGFAQFFTDDAPFVVGGALRGTGPEEICVHFQAIAEATDAVELKLPVKASLASLELGFVHYEVKAERDGQMDAEECLAVAHFREGRISSFEVIGRAA